MKFLKFTFLLFILQGCSSNYEWGWYILDPDNVEGLTNLKFLISGITTTIYISIIGFIGAILSAFMNNVAALALCRDNLR